MKRILTTLIASLCAFAVPMVYAWIKIGAFEHSEFWAHQFFLGTIGAATVGWWIFFCPEWSKD